MFDFDYFAFLEKASRKAAQRESIVKIGPYLEKLKTMRPENLLLAVSDQPDWQGALPMEALCGYLSEEDPQLVVGIDGSQMVHSREHPVQCAYIQAVSIDISTDEHLRAEFVDLHDRVAPVSIGLSPLDPAFTIPFWRTCLELKEAEWAARHYPDHITALDNPLLPFVSTGNHIGQRQLRSYLTGFKDLQDKLICGYVSGPRSTYLSKLLELSGCDLEIPITDSLFFYYLLEQGERSALFQLIDWRNKEFAKQGCEIYCFFIKVTENEVARVEIPAWVAKDSQRLDRVHASILDDAMDDGYPFSLRLAHVNVKIGAGINEECQKESLGWFLEEKGTYFLPAKVLMKLQ